MSRSRIEDALALAFLVHKGERDKNDKPLILHVLRVMGRMDLDDEEGMIVAILHDTVEGPNKELSWWGKANVLAERPFDVTEMLFGPEVALGLDAITRRNGERYDVYIARCAQDPLSRRVKLADLKDNLDPARQGPATERLQARYRAAIEYIVRLEWDERGIIDP